MQRKILALGPRFGLVLVPQLDRIQLPEVAIWTDFEILYRPLISNPHHVSPNDRIEPYHHLITCFIKHFSAWVEVWSATCCPEPSNSFIFVLIFLPSRHQPFSLVERTTKINEISYFNTATTHKPRLHIVQHKSTWSCYWVREYSFRYKPWFFVKVHGQRFLHENNWIFILACF